MLMQAAGGASMTTATMQQGRDPADVQEVTHVHATQQDADTTQDTGMAVPHETQVTEVIEVPTEGAGPEQQSHTADVAAATSIKDNAVSQEDQVNISAMHMCTCCYNVAFPA